MLLLILSVSAVADQEWPNQPPVIIDIVHGGAWGTETLADYVREHHPGDQQLIKTDGIACAAGGQELFATQQEGFPVSILVYPLPGAHTIRYYETATATDDPMEYTNFIERKVDEIKVFKGYLRRFVHPGVEEDVWGRIVYMAAGVMHISGAIRLKWKSKPTEFNPELLMIEGNGLNPKFDWIDGRIDENVIYFMALTDNHRNLLSGTYTRDKYFDFYDLDNVEINIRDVIPHPELRTGERYNFFLMGVSEDNWINFIASRRFVVDEKLRMRLKPGSL